MPLCSATVLRFLRRGLSSRWLSPSSHNCWQSLSGRERYSGSPLLDTIAYAPSCLVTRKRRSFVSSPHRCRLGKTYPNEGSSTCSRAKLQSDMATLTPNEFRMGLPQGCWLAGALLISTWLMDSQRTFL